MNIDSGILILSLLGAAIQSLPLIIVGVLAIFLANRLAKGRKFGPALKVIGWLAICGGLILEVTTADFAYRKTFAKGHEMFLADVLGRLRGDIDEYRKKHGAYPRTLGETDFKTILMDDWAGNPLPVMYFHVAPSGLPEVSLRFGLGHSPSSEVETYPFLDAKGKVDLKLLRDTGHWLYNPKTGRLLVDCTHHAAISSWAVAGNPPIYEW